MADYIYLLQNRLSLPQQAALQSIRDVAKTHGLTVFLVGGAVRDLTSGSPVRDLDVAVQGNALKLKKDMELAGAVVVGEITASQTFFARFTGGVRVEIGSTLSVSYPKPGKPAVQPATILDDLRRRDFTVNAMALSLNDGSYGLLMDPLNGVADIENRQLRLVSNYGFIEDPVRMIRATRYSARLGWMMEEKTQARYDNGKTEKYIGALSSTLRGYETEEIFHEEDPMRVLRKLEEEGWMKILFPALTSAKANAAEVERLRELQTQLQVAGVNPDAAAANFPLLTAKLTMAEVAELKKSFVRQGFVREIDILESEAKEFATQLGAKGAALPSQAWKLIHAAKPEAVLWAAFTAKSPAVQAKFKSFHTEWPKARQKVPFVLMQEMRIVPELESFNEVVEKIFFELMDGNLTTPEEQKAFLEPFSPPAPPPPVRLGRSRANKKEGKGSKSKKKLAEIPEDEEDVDLDLDADLEDEAPASASISDSGSDSDDELEETKPAILASDDQDDELTETPVVEQGRQPAPEPELVQPEERSEAVSKANRSKSAPAPKPKHAVPSAEDAVPKQTATAKKAQSDIVEPVVVKKVPPPPLPTKAAQATAKAVPAVDKKPPPKTTAPSAKQVEPAPVASPPAKKVAAKVAPPAKAAATEKTATATKAAGKKR